MYTWFLNLLKPKLIMDNLLVKYFKVKHYWYKYS